MSVNLKVPYLSQRDNEINPSGACNVTSVAMCLKYHGIVGDGSRNQLEDQLYQKFEDYGFSRHDPSDIQDFIQSYYHGNDRPKIKDDFTSHGTLENIKVALNNNIPCIVHGYFTRFGHIIVIRGYDDTGFFVNDPWGEYYDTGYVNKSGENLHYSYGLISRLCSPESVSKPNNIWLHRIQRIS